MGNSGPNTARAVRIVIAIIALACFVFGGVLAGAYLAVRQIVTTTAIEYAKALGIALSPAEVRFGLDFIQLLDSKFAALEVPGVTGSVRRIDIDLAGLRPSRVLLSGVAVEAKGEPIALKQAAMQYWERVRPKVPAGAPESGLPKVEWRHLSVSLDTGTAAMPNIAVTDLTITNNVGATQDETAIRTATTQIGTFDLGALEIAVRNQAGEFELGWGPTLLESKWRIAYRELRDADQVRFSFQPNDANTLFARLGVSVPPDMEKAKLGGHIEAVRNRTSGKTSGAATFNLTGFVPPYPAELKGYRFSDVTSLRARFDIDPLWFAAELRGIELKTGDLALTGHGRIDRELFSARLRAELTGALDCVTLARGYSVDEIGGELGKWGALNAPKAIRGSVSVKVQIDADSSRLQDAKIVKRIGIGCGLRPMSITELLNLGLPPPPDRQTIDRLLQRLPPEKVISNLATLPHLLPTLDELLDTPAPPFVRGSPAKQGSPTTGKTSPAKTGTGPSKKSPSAAATAQPAGN